MSSIGPHIPPHLTKRKRTPEDEAEADTPPNKAPRQANADEIALDSDSEDDYGPRAMPTKSIATSTTQPSYVGPVPTTKSHNDDEISLSDSDDNTGPAPPPSSRKAPATIPSQPSHKPKLPGPSIPKRIHGPAPPPADLSTRPSTGPDSPSSSDSDSDYGPSLPTASDISLAAHRAAHPSPPAPSSSGRSSAPQRDDWMLAPPTSTGYHERDPTKLKARKFGSVKSGGAPAEISNLWTETAAEKQKRLADAVLGRAPDPVGGPQPGASRDKQAREERDSKIRVSMEAARGPSLYEQHQAARKEGRGPAAADEEEDDPSKRAFDREKDMGLGGTISHSQRREMMNRAANFGGRFQKGSYL